MLLGDKFFLVFVLLLFDQMMKFPDLGNWLPTCVFMWEGVLLVVGD
jgi:hypothetical protein